MRLAICALLGVAVWAMLPGSIRPMTRLLIGFDVASIVFLSLIFATVAHAPEGSTRERAAKHDSGQITVLVLSIVAAGVCLSAIIVELSLVKQVAGFLEPLYLLFAVLTVLTAWCFVHVIFAIHYANRYFALLARASTNHEVAQGGLQIPGGNKNPEFSDFLYFSFVIGTTCCTSDISIASSSLRRVAMVQGIFAFFFNLTILGLMMSGIGGLMS